MDLGLSGASVLVVGGGGGLGGAVCRTLAREGAKVAVAGPRPASVEATVDALRDDGATALGVELDLADPESHRSALDLVRDLHGDVAVLVNFSGGPPPGPVTGIGASTWNTHFNAMVTGVIGLTDLVLPAMRSRGWGRIITGTSSGALTPIPALGISNSLRIALHGWSKTLAGEVGADGVTSNIVVPGRIATARVAQLDAARAQRNESTAEEEAARSMATIPMRRYGTTEEFAASVAFLASTQASYITGTVLRVDGGLIAAV